jgi:hypothetical protein
MPVVSSGSIAQMRLLRSKLTFSFHCQSEVLHLFTRAPPGEGEGESEILSRCQYSVLSETDSAGFGRLFRRILRFMAWFVFEASSRRFVPMSCKGT